MEVNTKEIKSIAVLYLHHQRFKQIWRGRECLLPLPPLGERYQN